MKYIVDFPSKLVAEIDNLILKGKYESISQFTVVAVENQLLLEKSPEEKLSSLKVSEVSQTKVKESDAMTLLSLNIPFKKIQTVPSPKSERIPNDCLWGQYNRILPIKITMRILANLLGNGQPSIDMNMLQRNAVVAARDIGLVLRKKDREQRRQYGDRLSSALPIGRNARKAENRFINHFVGYVTRAGRIEGAPAALKFIDAYQDVDGSYKVGITDAGLQFASLRNPIIDDKQYEASLSEEESDFFIKHVRENLEREAKAIKLVLENIKKGMSSPSKLNLAFKNIARDWSDDMTNTMRAGVISRLHEIGLVERRKKGTEVTYFLTARGDMAFSRLQEEKS